MTSVKRNYGIDLLRILSILGVAILHILGHGGILNSALGTENYAVSWFWEVFAYPSVNCFVLISGYVGYREGKPYPKLTKLVDLFLTVLFYSVASGAVFNHFFPDKVLPLDIITTFFPIATNQYWFFSVYFGMFLISPLLNTIIDSSEEKMLKLMLLIPVVFGFCTLHLDVLALTKGYSVIWFILLYLCGGAVKKLKLPESCSVLKLICFGAGLFLVTYLLKLAYLTDLAFIPHVDVNSIAGKLISYCSPTILGISLCTLCLFAKLKIPACFHKLIGFITPCVFSVYLIHDNHFFRKFIMAGRFKSLHNYNAIGTSLLVLLIAIAIFIGCVSIDKIRGLLFRLLRIDRLSTRLGAWLTKFILWLPILPRKKD